MVIQTCFYNSLFPLYFFPCFDTLIHFILLRHAIKESKMAEMGLWANLSLMWENAHPEKDAFFISNSSIVHLMGHMELNYPAVHMIQLEFDIQRPSSSTQSCSSEFSMGFMCHYSLEEQEMTPNKRGVPGACPISKGIRNTKNLKSRYVIIWLDLFSIYPQPHKRPINLIPVWLK